jgi:CBS domain-containing protein
VGIFSGVVGFGLGYAAGMKVGDRPIRAARGVADEARARASSVSTAAARMRSRITGLGERTIDVREVREVMTAAPETVTPDTTIRDAAATMERADVGNLLVVENEQLRGIVTDRDIAVRAVGRGLDPSVRVRDVQTPSTVSVSPTATVAEAVAVMRDNDVRRVPVVEAGRPIGIVSLGDLAVSREPKSLLADITSAPPNN